MTVLSLRWESLYLERWSLHWNTTQVSLKKNLQFSLLFCHVSCLSGANIVYCEFRFQKFHFKQILRWLLHSLSPIFSWYSIDGTFGSIKCMWWKKMHAVVPLQWNHNGHDGISNHQPHHCLLNRLFRRRSQKVSKLRVTGLCAGNSPVTGEFLHKWPVSWKMFPFYDVIMPGWHALLIW